MESQDVQDYPQGYMVEGYACRVEVLHCVYGVVRRRVCENCVDASGTVSCCCGFFREASSTEGWWGLSSVPVFKTVKNQPCLNDFLGVL